MNKKGIRILKKENNNYVIARIILVDAAFIIFFLFVEFHFNLSTKDLDHPIKMCRNRITGFEYCSLPLDPINS